MFFGFFSPTRSFKALSQHPSLYHTPFLLAFFFLRSSVWVFSSECLNFIFLFFQKIIFFSSCLFFFLVYRWNWIVFFCSCPMEDNHSSNCHLIAKLHSSMKGRNTGERALKSSDGICLYLCLMVQPSLTLPVFIPFLLFSSLFLCLFFLKHWLKISVFLQ